MQKSLDDKLAEIQDLPDRIASAAIALSNGDEPGARAVLKGADLNDLVMMVLGLCVQLGNDRLGLDGFARVLRAWAAEARKLDRHNPRGRRLSDGQ